MLEDTPPAAWAVEVARLVNHELEALSSEDDGIMARDGIASLGPARLLSDGVLAVAMRTHEMRDVQQTILRDLKAYWAGMSPRNPQTIASIVVSEVTNFRALPLRQLSNDQWEWG